MRDPSMEFVSLDLHKLTITADNKGKRLVSDRGFRPMTTGKRRLATLEVAPSIIFNTGDRLIPQSRLDDLQELTIAFCDSTWGIGEWDICGCAYIEIGIDVDAGLSSLIMSAQYIQFDNLKPEFHLNKSGQPGGIYWGKAHSRTWAVKLYQKESGHCRFEAMIGRDAPQSMKVSNPYDKSQIYGSFIDALSRARPLDSRSKDQINNHRNIKGPIKRVLQGDHWMKPVNHPESDILFS